MNRPEQKLQKQIVKYIRLQYPDALFTATVAELRKNRTQAAIAKGMGYTAGTPDLLIFSVQHPYNGLAIEFKAGNGRATESQKTFMEKLKANGWACLIIDDFDTAKKILDEYLG